MGFFSTLVFNANLMLTNLVRITGLLSPRNLPVPGSPGLELMVCMNSHGFLCRYWSLNIGPYIFRRSTLLIMPSFQPGLSIFKGKFFTSI